MKHHGWRKPTPDQAAQCKRVRAGEEISVPKNKAILACKRVAARIGLKAADILLLDTLSAFSKPQDWMAGRSAVVWPSNVCLMEATGFSLSTLKRHARRLAELGLIAFRDSPNGKRWGHRDMDGHIVEAYGFDLSPLATRQPEFAALYDTIKTERDLCTRLRRKITIERRNLRALLEASKTALQGHEYQQLCADYAQLIANLPDHRTSSDRLFEICHAFAAAHERLQLALPEIPENDDEAVVIIEDKSQSAGQKAIELTPSPAKNDPHIQTTNQHSKKESSVDQKNGFNDASTPQPAMPPSFKLIVSACSSFRMMVQDMQSTLRDWNDLHRNAGIIRSMLGISENDWNVAQTDLGSHSASAAIALIFEKFNEGTVKSPAGYLRGMIRKEKAGQLYLNRSLHGRQMHQTTCPTA